MSFLGQFKFVCIECGSDNWVRRHDRTRAAGLRCTACGSRALQPASGSKAHDAIATANAERAEREASGRQR